MEDSHDYSKFKTYYTQDITDKSKLEIFNNLIKNLINSIKNLM